MSGHIGRRLDRLAALYGVRGCDVCAPWEETVVVIETPGMPATVPPASLVPIAVDRPGCCAGCGRRRPDRTTTVIIEAPDHDEAEVLT